MSPCFAGQLHSWWQVSRCWLSCWRVKNKKPQMGEEACSQLWNVAKPTVSFWYWSIITIIHSNLWSTTNIFCLAIVDSIPSTIGAMQFPSIIGSMSADIYFTSISTSTHHNANRRMVCNPQLAQPLVTVQRAKKEAFWVNWGEPPGKNNSVSLSVALGRYLVKKLVSRLVVDG